MVNDASLNASLIDTQIGNYLLIKRLGAGGFGSVYLAQHRFLNRRTVAIKILNSQFLNTDKEKEAFFNEAKFLDILKHRHILPILDVGIQENQPYMMVEYAPKGSLLDRIKEQRPARLSMKEALLILSQVGQALQYAHRSKIVHRDLKPANILFNEREDAVLADFGIAIQLKEETEHAEKVMGSFPYMAPEHFHGMVSEKSDQYALACIAYQLFTGRVPLAVSARLDPQAAFWVWQQKVDTEKPQSPLDYNPDLGSEIADVLLRALSKDRDKRYPDISAFVSAMTSQMQLLAIPDIPTMLVSIEVLQDVHLEAQKTVEQWLAEADEHYKNNRLAEALAAYEHAMQLGHDSADTSYLQGSILYKLERLEEALEAYDKAIQLGYKDPMVHYQRGYILGRLNRYEEALTAYEQAIQLDPTKAMFHSNKGNVFRELKHYADAQEAYEEAIKLSPNTPVFHINKGDVLFTLQDFEQAVDAYDQAIKVAPHNNKMKAKAYVGKATALMRLRLPKQAVEAYENAAAIDPNIVSTSFYLAKGDALWRCGENQKALEAYEQGLVLEPQNERLQQKISAMQDIIQGKHKRS